MKRLKNSWEVMECVSGPNGSKAKTRSKVCHAAEEITLDGDMTAYTVAGILVL